MKQSPQQPGGDETCELRRRVTGSGIVQHIERMRMFDVEGRERCVILWSR